MEPYAKRPTTISCWLAPGREVPKLLKRKGLLCFPVGVGAGAIVERPPVVQDFILNPDKTGPQHAALFSLNMLVATEAGASYSEFEYTRWMKAVVFTEVCRINLPGPSDLIVGLVK